MHTSDLYRDLKPSDTDFVALDGEEVVGRVYRIPHGTEEGMWFWSMTLDLPGPRLHGREGREARRGDAARRVVEAYERMQASRRHRLDY